MKEREDRYKYLELKILKYFSSQKSHIEIQAHPSTWDHKFKTSLGYLKRPCLNKLKHIATKKCPNNI
jgi:hypothetical protein